jgi:hypothetical protein
MKSYLSISCWAAGILFRKSLPIPITSRLFSVPYCTNFRVSGQILRCLIHFEFILVQGNRHGSSFSFLQDSHFSQQHLLKRMSYLHHLFLAPLSKIRWVYLCGFIFRSSVLYYWSSFLFLCQDHCFYCYCFEIAFILILSLLLLILGFACSCFSRSLSCSIKSLI